MLKDVIIHYITCSKINMSKIERLVNNIGAFLLGDEPKRTDVDLNNKLANSFMYGVDDLSTERISKKNKLVNSVIIFEPTPNQE